MLGLWINQAISQTGIKIGPESHDWGPINNQNLKELMLESILVRN